MRHKFENKTPHIQEIIWPHGFATTNAILSATPYKPEVIIIGTFNHDWPWNDADFFYGRGMYMWTVMANLFLHNANIQVNRRNPTPPNNTPTLNEIFQICKKGKLCFADIILGINPNIPTEVDNLNQQIIVNNGDYIWKNHGDKALNTMGNLGWLDNNIQNIISFINRTPSIKHIYFTFATGGDWIVGLKDSIINEFLHLQVGSIYTPTGMRLPNSEEFPCRPFSLAHHWVWNNHEHPINPVNNDNYIHFDHGWLIRNGVEPNNF